MVIFGLSGEAGGSPERTKSRTLRVQPHLCTRDLERRYRRCRDVGERERPHCVLLKLKGLSSKEGAAGKGSVYWG